MSHAVVHGLRARGVDVVTAMEAGLIEQEDGEHLTSAAAEQRTLYSFNVGDFQRLHTAWMQQNKSHAGIVLARQQSLTVGEQVRRLLKLMSKLTTEEMQNRLEFLGSWA